ncbi:hypothetical protein N7463_004158 [Penicillium fimorum]|uniref:Uncharacterized protein n=1 Tax=Penicillium fimorum TaxID=1882269 RepID=A0A9W9Y2A9_9EURO|nr:hypothetical protein N7463_004158 [Penicillium fimorum]
MTTDPVFGEICLDPVDHPPEREGLLETYVEHARNTFHAIATHSIDLYHLLGQLDRYCRLVVDGGVRDLKPSENMGFIFFFFIASVKDRWFANPEIP